MAEILWYATFDLACSTRNDQIASIDLVFYLHTSTSDDDRENLTYLGIFARLEALRCWNVDALRARHRGKPVAFQAEHRPRCEGGKLRYEYDGASFDVDVETMRRTGGSDRFPPFVSVEQ